MCSSHSPVGPWVCAHQLVRTEHLGLLERLKGGHREEGGHRGRHREGLLTPHSGLIWGGATQQVHGKGGGGRWDPKGIRLAWTRSGSPFLPLVTVSKSTAPWPGASVAPGPLSPAPPRPLPHPGPRCLRAPGTCPSADVPRRWCDCFSAVIFNRL